MNVYHEKILAYLEEDNAQRAYFRVKPLLSVSGLLSDDAKREWPDDGALRIVPDRGEKFHFKDRMRTLGAYCLVDLTAFTEDANKIRTNKNYNAAGEEHNQFILYSDAIRDLTDAPFTEIVNGVPSDFADLAAKAATAKFYIRHEDRLYGPVLKAAPSLPEAAEEAAGTFFSVPCPDGVTRDILYLGHETPSAAEAAPAAKPAEPQALPVVHRTAPRPAPEAASVQAAPPVVAQPAVQAEQPAQPEAPAGKTEEPSVPRQEVQPAPKPEEPPVPDDAPLEIGKTLHILDEGKTVDEHLSEIARPLSKTANLLSDTPVTHHVSTGAAPQLTGTPLMRSTGLRTAAPRPRNPVQEVVTAQWRAARNEEPSATLSQGAVTRSVVNPVEAALSALTSAWQLPEAHQQVVHHILSLPGMNQKLAQVQSASSATPLQGILSARLQDLEAERLSTLFQLDKAKENLESFRKTAVDALTVKAAADLRSAEKTLENKKSSCETIRKELSGLAKERDALLAEIDKLQGDVLPDTLTDALRKTGWATLQNGRILRLSAAAGTKLEPKALVDRVTEAMKLISPELQRGDAVTLLTLLALAPRFSLCAPMLSAPVTLLRSLFALCGWGSGLQLQENADQQLTVTPLPDGATPVAVMSALLLPLQAAPVHTVLLCKSAAVHARTAAWEIEPWPVWQLPQVKFAAVSEPVDASPASAESLAALASTYGASAQEVLTCLAPITELLQAALPETTRNAMVTFVRVSSAFAEGGLADAIDRCLALYLPGILALHGGLLPALKALLGEYPLTLRLVSQG